MTVCVCCEQDVPIQEEVEEKEKEEKKEEVKEEEVEEEITPADSGWCVTVPSHYPVCGTYILVTVGSESYAIVLFMRLCEFLMESHK